ncbi:MAG: hypothetical protein KDJ77_10375 [Rhodobiaceae bacterium]|nr:hypothetical protein [Rhodobiaceae bacterium]
MTDPGDDGRNLHTAEDEADVVGRPERADDVERKSGFVCPIGDEHTEQAGPDFQEGDRDKERRYGSPDSQQDDTSVSQQFADHQLEAAVKGIDRRQ